MTDRYQVIHGDCLAAMAALPADHAHAVVTDPPYHLISGSRGGSLRSNDRSTPFGRTGGSSAGFMGETWDGGDIAHRREVWAECLRVARPGAHLLAFGGSRTFHRIACAIEDAGWEIRDTIMWVYGSGLGKGRSASKDLARNGHDVAAILWDGWQPCLKPCYEPIVLARKPFKGPIGDNLMRYGCGALNIDGCRIPSGPDYAGAGWGDRFTANGRYTGAFEDRPSANAAIAEGRPVKTTSPHPLGRMPGNLCHDGSQQVLDLFPDVSSGANPRRRGADTARGVYGRFGGQVECVPARGADRGSAARFFYCAKVTTRDREEGCEELDPGVLARSGGAQSDASKGAIADGVDHGKAFNAAVRRRNFHATVKPCNLMRWLVRLVTPADGLVLDPFCGSGSTGKACAYEGMRFIGIDQDERYCAIARARIEWALRQAAETVR